MAFFSMNSQTMTRVTEAARRLQCSWTRMVVGVPSAKTLMRRYRNVVLSYRQL